MGIGDFQRGRIIAALVIAALATVIGGRAVSGLYVEVLWFSHLGYGSYFWTFKGLHWLISLALGVSAGAFLFANLYPLLRHSPRLRIRRRYGNIEISELFPRWYLTLGAVALSALYGWTLGGFVGRRLTLPLLQALNGPEWGTLDPIFSRDLSFFVFTLPVMSGRVNERKFEIVGRAVDHFSKHYEVTDIDGARIMLEGGWALVRASNTQPVIVLRFEAGDQERLEAIERVVGGWLREQGLAV